MLAEIGSPSTSTWRLVEVPAAGPHQQRGRLGFEHVALAAGCGEFDRAGHRVAQVHLALRACLARWARGNPRNRPCTSGRRIERIDDHLAVDRSGNFDAAVLKVGWHRRDPPIGGADVGGLVQKVRATSRRRIALGASCGPPAGRVAAPGCAVRARPRSRRAGRVTICVASLGVAASSSIPPDRMAVRVAYIEHLGGQRKTSGFQGGVSGGSCPRVRPSW